MGCSGLTLLETVIALGVVALLSALTVLPSTIFTDKTNWNQTTITVRDTIQQARNLARSHNQCVTLNITATAMVVTGYTMPTPLASPNPCIPPLPGPSSTYSPTFQTGVTFVPFNLENPLVFLPSGGTDLTTSTKMQVLQQNNSRSYSVNPILGQIVETTP